MALTFSPFFTASEQKLEKVMLAQQQRLEASRPQFRRQPAPTHTNQPPLPDNMFPVTQQAQIPLTPPPTRYLEQDESKLTPIHVVRYFFKNNIFGHENEHIWFWFLMLFLFCIVMFGFNVYLSNKLDSIVNMQSRLFILASK